MTNFGADKIILIRLYTSLLRSKIHYGRQAYGSAAKSHLKKLDTIQATALRIATGAYKGTQTFSLEVECNILPLQKRRDEIYFTIQWLATTCQGTYSNSYGGGGGVKTFIGTWLWERVQMGRHVYIVATYTATLP